MLLDGRLLSGNLVQTSGQLIDGELYPRVIETGGGGGGAVETCTVQFTVYNSRYLFAYMALTYENGIQVQKYDCVPATGGNLEWPTFENVICGSVLMIYSAATMHSIVTGAELIGFYSGHRLYKITAADGETARIELG